METELSFVDLDTSEKIISSIAGAVAILTAIIAWARHRRHIKRGSGAPAAPINSNANNINVNVGSVAHETSNSQPAMVIPDKSIHSLKRSANILFIDDDKGYKMFSILRRMGWEHTKQVTDLNSLEAPVLTEAHIIFVDIQGVGRAMGYKDEGLGLALSIKRRHPEKGVVIYSAEEHGARFHEALQEADSALPKTAEPIRFENTIVKVLSK